MFIMRKTITRTRLFLSACLLFSGVALAETPQQILAGYTQQAKTANASFAGFDAARGQQFFTSKHGNDWSCSSCHTSNPMQNGKHARTGKLLEPLAPAANAERFTRPQKVEKWFKRNCNDVVGRECTALEKGDVMTYLLSLK